MNPQRSGALCLLKILFEYSDEDNILTMKDILDKLGSLYGIHTERRAVYRYINSLLYLGYDISIYDENGAGYYLRSRPLEKDDISLITDCIRLYAPISETKLIHTEKRLNSILSVNSRRPLKHMITAPYIDMNARLTLIDSAIDTGRKIHFLYSCAGICPPPHNDIRTVSPYTLVSARNEYWLIGGDNGHMSLYRVSGIEAAELCGESSEPLPDGYEPHGLVLKELYDFGAENETVVIRCAGSLAQSVSEVFGKRAHILIRGENDFSAAVEIPPGRILPWALENIDCCEIISPESLRKDIIRRLKTSAYLNSSD